MAKHSVLFQYIAKRLFAARLLVGWVVEACEHDTESELVQGAWEIVRLRVRLQLQGVAQVQVDHLPTNVGWCNLDQVEACEWRASSCLASQSGQAIQLEEEGSVSAAMLKTCHFRCLKLNPTTVRDPWS